VRYFGQNPDYWLDTCTLDDWTRIWSRELRETPPADVWAGLYFNYQPPEAALPGDNTTDVGEWDSGLPDETE